MKAEKRAVLSERDLLFLASLGDTKMGSSARWEYAQMANVPVEEINEVVLGIIYGD